MKRLRSLFWRWSSAGFAGAFLFVSFLVVPLVALAFLAVVVVPLLPAMRRAGVTFSFTARCRGGVRCLRDAARMRGMVVGGASTVL